MTTAHANVVEALAAVMAELPGIGKDMKSGDSGSQSYKYRGIEQITAAAQPLFAKHGVVIVPTTIEWRDRIEFQVKSGATWTDERVLVSYRIYGPGGRDDYLDAQLPGIGRDNSDKGTNKALTQAYKYLLLQMLMVADPKDDADHEPKQERDGGAAQPADDWREKFIAACEGEGIDPTAVCLKASRDARRTVETFDREEVPILRNAFKALCAEREHAADGDGDGKADAPPHEQVPADGPPTSAGPATTPTSPARSAR